MAKIQEMQQKGHLEKLENVSEKIFISTAVTTVKNDETVKIAWDSRKLNDSCTKKRYQMPTLKIYWTEYLEKYQKRKIFVDINDQFIVSVRKIRIRRKNKETLLLCFNQGKTERLLQIQKKRKITESPKQRQSFKTKLNGH